MTEDHKYIIHIKELSVEIVYISIANETKICVSQGVVEESTHVAIKLAPKEFKHLGGGGNGSDVDVALFRALHSIWLVTHTQL